MHNSKIAREGWPYIGLCSLITLVLAMSAYKYYSILPLVLALFFGYFFRNPERTVPQEEGLILAPADGKIIAIGEVQEDQYIQAQSLRITIFLNLFSVHINRIPIAGEIEWTARSGSTYIPAYKSGASGSNVSNTVAILSAFGRIKVVQITGMVARRIVCWMQPGDKVQTGERFGLIKFGSCTELYLPLDATIMVRPGDKVKGGETIIGRFGN